MNRKIVTIDTHAHFYPCYDYQQVWKAIVDSAVQMLWLAERFDIQHQWDGDTLNFNRSGVDGKIKLSPKKLHVTAQLGFMLSMLKGPIEAEIRRVLSEKFD